MKVRWLFFRKKHLQEEVLMRWGSEGRWVRIACNTLNCSTSPVPHSLDSPPPAAKSDFSIHISNPKKWEAFQSYFSLAKTAIRQVTSIVLITPLFLNVDQWGSVRETEGIRPGGLLLLTDFMSVWKFYSPSLSWGSIADKLPFWQCSLIYGINLLLCAIRLLLQIASGVGHMAVALPDSLARVSQWQGWAIGRKWGGMGHFRWGTRGQGGEGRQCFQCVWGEKGARRS